ncbi:MAG TPA: hypothetical protein VKT72_07375, partial [Candidatus Baltobacteraceae bacterium]|nr:hypothetical protein [Candidatus Baltobacteraceae bacterium]
MLSAPISPISLPQNYNAEELSQAFAMTMLASYANVALDSRTIQSFANSYGVAQLWQMPAVPLVTPPVTIAKIPYSWGNHVIIALAGTPNGASLVAQWWNSSFAVTSTNPVGKVHHMYNVAATAVATAIAAVPALVTLLADPRTEVTFTGYSFGAAVADLMASTMICLAPTRKIRLRKFASPRCGNLEYYANTPAQLNTVAIYRQNDGVF